MILLGASWASARFSRGVGGQPLFCYAQYCLFPSCQALLLPGNSIFVLCLMAFSPVLPEPLLSGRYFLVSPFLYSILIIIYYLYNANVFLLVVALKMELGNKGSWKGCA